MKSINHPICSRCGGFCCKTMAGATEPKEWGSPDVNVMRQRITDGLRSARWIVAIAPNKLLYVMPRMTSTGCTFLKSDGCVLSDTERPIACRTLIPRLDFHCTASPGQHVEDYAKLWKPYQSMLIDIDDEMHRQPIRKPKGIWGRFTS